MVLGHAACRAADTPASDNNTPLQVNCELTVSHSGKSDVYVTGYTTRQYLSFGTSSDEEGEWESESDEEPLPLAGKQLPNGPSPAKQVRAACKRASLRI